MQAAKLNTADSQTGLAYFPDHAIYAAYASDGGKAITYAQWQNLARELESHCASTGFRTVVLKGVGFEQWQAWANDKVRPKGMGSRDKLVQHAQAFGHTGGDLWFHVKSDSAAGAAATLALIEAALKGRVTDGPSPVVAQKRLKGKVLGGRFTDGLENPADDEDLSLRVLIGDEDEAHRGGAFLISQRFEHDWDKIDAMSEMQKQNMIGRDGSDRILPIDDESSHIKRARHIMNGERMNARLLRQALPYGQADGNPSHEKGVMFAGYAQSTEMLDSILDSIAGSRPGFIQDSLFGVTRGVEGSYWYLPSRSECGLQDTAPPSDVTMNDYFDVRSRNGWMFYNARDYQHKIRNSKLVEDCPISERILELLNKQFSRWQDTWYKPRETPALGHLREHLQHGDPDVLNASVMLRKGLATKLSLCRVMTERAYADRANLLRIDADEIIVGNMPQFSLGIGTQVMEYLNDDEQLINYFGKLNESSATGHNVPDYPMLLAHGIGALITRYQARLAATTGNTGSTRDFFQAAIWSLEGLSDFIGKYAGLAREMAKVEKGDVERMNLLEIAARMDKLARARPDTFVEGLQLIFITNCALHQVGEQHSIGRLDQYLIALHDADIARGTLTPAQAQEAIDAFWLKMDETVLYNYTHINDYLNYGGGGVFYEGSNFPQGAAINQWVQQVTVGGYKATDDAEPQDASNAITRMCLRASRRLPLNAPCLSLRVHRKMSPDLFEEAAKAVLSGGAHPILLNDDHLVPALHACGDHFRLADARDYSCDGCYEPIIPGRTEWTFNYLFPLTMVEYALNQGCDIQGAGPIGLRGNKFSWNSPPPAEIKSFEQFKGIFQKHWQWTIASNFFNSLMTNYGALAAVCPSPLFSALMTDAADTGLDLTEGGARYHLAAPMMCGIGDAIDSLYAIKKLVFDPETARCTLPQLLLCLQCDWGYKMQPPFYAASAGALRLQGDAEFFQQLRDAALALPKFGIDSDPELVELGRSTIADCVAALHEGLKSPLAPIHEGYAKIKKRLHRPGHPFEFIVTPGVGTFEDNVGLGITSGASANGRRNTQPYAADFTAMPQPPDLPFKPRRTPATRALKDWNHRSITHGIANAAPVDINIPEDFPLDSLTELIRAFAHGETGSNLLTITCADPETYDAAMQFPERYDLLRVRTGGWSEFFVAMFDFHQEYFRRRVYYTP